MTITLEVTEGVHFNPWYNFNLGNWQTVIGCDDCNSYFAYDDINPFSPCQNCGGYISGYKKYTGKWINGQWAIRKQKEQL